MNETMSHDDFFDAFDSDDGYQTGTEDAVEETNEESTGTTETEQTNDEAVAETEDGTESGDAANGDNGGDADKKSGAEQKQEADTFVLKVNKEERTVTRDEVIALAQKGADYDRVKAAAEQVKSDNTALIEQNAKMKEAYDLLTTLAEGSKISVPELLRAFRVNHLKGQGLSEDAAKERVAREDAERELKAIKAEQQAVQQKPDNDRAKRELEEFRKVYPDVELTKELVDSMLPDVQAGMTMTQAYQKREAAEKDEKIRQLQADLEAERKNRENRASSPGSQKDSGAKRVRSQYDAFFAEYDD